MPVRVGIVGFGGFGRFLRQSWSALDEVAVVAVADSDPAVDPGDLQFHSSWRDLVSDPAIELVSIVTPPFTHAEIACAALEAGKHVLIEKPIATTRRDAERILETAHATGKIAAVDYMLRFNPIVEAVHAWSHERPFGELRHVLVENYAQDEGLPPRHWFWDLGKSGGILVEHSVHFIDIVSGCTLARPQSVNGFAVRRNERQIDRMGFTVLFDDGLVATQYHAFSRPGPFEETTMRFVFDLAELHVEGWIPLRGSFSALVTPEKEGALMQLPGSEIIERTDVGRAIDESRPGGWGDTSHRTGRGSVRSGGIGYKASALVKGRFAMPISKSEAYASALRSLMQDVVRGVHDPDHRLRVRLEDGVSSLELALRATEDALSSSRFT